MSPSAVPPYAQRKQPIVAQWIRGQITERYFAARAAHPPSATVSMCLVGIACPSQFRRACTTAVENHAQQKLCAYDFAADRAEEVFFNYIEPSHPRYLQMLTRCCRTVVAGRVHKKKTGSSRVSGSGVGGGGTRDQQSGMDRGSSWCVAGETETIRPSGVTGQMQVRYTPFTAVCD